MSGFVRVYIMSIHNDIKYMYICTFIVCIMDKARVYHSYMIKIRETCPNSLYRYVKI